MALPPKEFWCRVAAPVASSPPAPPPPPPPLRRTASIPHGCGDAHLAERVIRLPPPPASSVCAFAPHLSTHCGGASRPSARGDKTEGIVGLLLPRGPPPITPVDDKTAVRDQTRKPSPALRPASLSAVLHPGCCGPPYLDPFVFFPSSNGGVISLCRTPSLSFLQPPSTFTFQRLDSGLVPGQVDARGPPIRWTGGQQRTHESLQLGGGARIGRPEAIRGRLRFVSREGRRIGFCRVVRRPATSPAVGMLGC